MLGHPVHPFGNNTQLRAAGGCNSPRACADAAVLCRPRRRVHAAVPWQWLDLWRCCRHRQITPRHCANDERGISNTLAFSRDRIFCSALYRDVQLVEPRSRHRNQWR